MDVRDTKVFRQRPSFDAIDLSQLVFYQPNSFSVDFAPQSFNHKKAGSLMKINEFCRNCLLRKNLQAYPPSASPEQAAAYQKEVCSIVDRCSGLSAPEITEKMDNLRWDMFGARKD